ncbi:MAG TPA: ROK family transcriptional regulator [Anaeromyxobacter sp.]|nr:ROK family transcriptional regulator [Anaeromyxobacter sp.]
MATPRSIRYLNEIRALNALLRAGGMSRADLARHLGMNRSSIGFIVEDLLADGLARERAATPGPGAARRSGRPGIVVELDPDGAAFLGVEIGVDHLTVVAVDLSARERVRRTVAYPTRDRPAAAGLARAAALVEEAVGGLRLPRTRLRGVCVAVPALVRDGVVRNALMLGWRNVPVQALLRRRLGVVPIRVENDANAFAFGETYAGAAARADTVAFLLVENGAGGGVVIGGQLHRGASGFAGEFGQLPVAGADGRGHLERHIGKDAVLARYRAHGAPRSADLPHLLAALRAREPAALRTAREWGDHLARGLVAITDVLAPGRIVLGGSVAPLFPHVADRVEAAMRGELLEGLPVPRVEVSRLGPEGAAFGGACLLHQSLFAVDEGRVHARERPAGGRGRARLRAVRARRPPPKKEPER